MGQTRGSRYDERIEMQANLVVGQTARSHSCARRLLVRLTSVASSRRTTVVAVYSVGMGWKLGKAASCTVIAENELEQQPGHEPVHFLTEIVTPHLELEGHVDGRRGEGFTSATPEPLEAGDEVFIEHGHFAVEDQSGFRESSCDLG